MKAFEILYCKDKADKETIFNPTIDEPGSKIVFKGRIVERVQIKQLPEAIV